MSDSYTTHVSVDCSQLGNCMLRRRDTEKQTLRKSNHSNASDFFASYFFGGNTNVKKGVLTNRKCTHS